MDPYTKIKYNCRMATFLIEKGHHKPLTIRENVLLRIHLFTCPFCRLYKKQSALLEKFISNFFAYKKGQHFNMSAHYKSELNKLIAKKIKNRTDNL
jgi:hypothetical protein